MLWLDEQRLECYSSVLLTQVHTNTLIATWLKGLCRKEQRHMCTLWFWGVILFFRDTLNNQCPLQSNPYSPYPCLQDIKHQLLCQILFWSQEWQVGHTNESWIHIHTHTGTHTNFIPNVHASYASSSFPCLRHTNTPILHMHTHTFTPISNPFFFFELESGGAERGLERSLLANVHNEKCKLCHFLQIKVFWWESETIAGH